jgi:hypothetical protein
MNVLKDMSETEIADIIFYFPALNDNNKNKYKSTTGIDRLIKKNNSLHSNKTQIEILDLLIDRYFKLESYNSLKDLSLIGWATQFLFRNRIINRLTTPDLFTVDLTRRNYNIQSTIFELIRKPVIDHNRYPLMYLDHSSSVNDLNVYDLHTISEEHIKDNSFGMIVPDDEVTNELFNLYVSPVNNILAHGSNPRITATIDLSINDSQLKEDFAEYLSRKRAELNIAPIKPKKFKPGKVKSLIDNRVLQYLDLRILDLYVNDSYCLEQHKLAALIFPEINTDTTEKIRKSTIPYATEMMDMDVINALLIENRKIHPGITRTGK